MPSDNNAQELYLESLIMQLTGWHDPRRRLEQALSGNEFILFQQCIAPLAAGDAEPPFVEVLIRLEDEEKHLTPPGAFLPLLEHHGMMPALDRWVVRRVLEWQAPRAGQHPRRFCLNAAPQTLSQPDFPTYVRDQLSRHPVDPAALCFEIREGDLKAQGEGMRSTTQGLRALGCHIAVGAVGRESFSFKSITAMGAELIKIDGALVRELGSNPVAKAKIAALVRVCDSAGMRTVAELVEEPETVERLRTLGVHYAQGFGISRPAPLAELER